MLYTTQILHRTNQGMQGFTAGELKQTAVVSGSQRRSVPEKFYLCIETAKPEVIKAGRN